MRAKKILISAAVAISALAGAATPAFFAAGSAAAPAAAGHAQPDVLYHM